MEPHEAALGWAGGGEGLGGGGSRGAPNVQLFFFPVLERTSALGSLQGCFCWRLGLGSGLSGGLAFLGFLSIRNSKILKILKILRILKILKILSLEQDS